MLPSKKIQNGTQIHDGRENIYLVEVHPKNYSACTRSYV
jgi:hypothetical protein